jgi:Zn finger protein HypA/HybF involved in hydrogenase expression
MWNVQEHVLTTMHPILPLKIKCSSASSMARQQTSPMHTNTHVCPKCEDEADHLYSLRSL